MEPTVLSKHPDGTDRAFHSVWDHHNHPRHQQYSAAISPKLWACRCLLHGTEYLDEFRGYTLWAPWRLPLRLPWCPRFAARYELVCLIDQSEFASVWAARRKELNEEGRHDYFAVKVAPNPLYRWHQFGWNPDEYDTIMENQDRYREPWRYPQKVKIDTASLRLQNLSVRFRVDLGDAVHALLEAGEVTVPRHFESYDHGLICMTVMELCVSQRFLARLETLPPLEPNPVRWAAAPFEELPVLYSCTGERYGAQYCASHDVDWLDEPIASRINHSLLKELGRIFELGLTYRGFTLQDFVLSDRIKPTLVGFGETGIHPRSQDFWTNEPPHERRGHRDPPEVIEPALNGRDKPFNRTREDLWGLTTIIYELLHGRLPWSYDPDDIPPEWTHVTDALLANDHTRIQVPPQIREDLSQDCIDMLQACLQIKPALRPDIEEMFTFPWFSGWQERADYEPLFWNEFDEFDIPE